MSNDGKNITECWAEMRKIFEQIILLIQTADTKMIEYKLEKASPAPIDVNQRLWRDNWRQQLLPSEIFSLYYTKDDKILCFVSILLHDPNLLHYPENDYYQEIKEPIITAGWFDYGDKEIENNWQYWYSRFHGYMKDRIDDGITWMKATPGDLPDLGIEKEELPFKYVAPHKNLWVNSGIGRSPST